MCQPAGESLAVAILCSLMLVLGLVILQCIALNKEALHA